MTTDAARITLGINADASTGEIRSAYEQLKAQLAASAERAPTPSLQAKYRQRIADVEIAFQRLQGAGETTAAADARENLPRIHRLAEERPAAPPPTTATAAVTRKERADPPRPRVAQPAQPFAADGSLASLDFAELKARYRAALAEAKSGTVSHAEIVAMRNELSSRGKVFEKQERQKGREVVRTVLIITVILIVFWTVMVLVSAH